MGLTAIVSSSASSASSSSAAASASVTSMLSPVGAGVGGIFVAATLIWLLAYLDLLDASDLQSDRLRQTLAATIVPLFVVFVGIVAFQTMTIL